MTDTLKSEAFSFDEALFPSYINEIYFKELIDFQKNKGRENFIKIITENPENPRLNYVCWFLFKQNLGLSFQLFDYSKHPDISYNEKVIEYASEKKIPESLHLKKDGWIDQTTIPEKIINDYIYIPDKESVLNKDFFSFIFFHISRYEEWANKARDRHGRFESEQSLLYQHKIHEYPIVNIGINLFKNLLIEKNFIPNNTLTNHGIKKILTVDIDNGYAFQGKGFFRTAGAFCIDLIKGNFKQINHRIKVLKGDIPDPFDVYEELFQNCTLHNIPLLYFVLLSDKKPYNRFLQKGNRYRVKLFKTILSNSQILPGLHASYECLDQPSLYNKEIKDFQLLSGNYPSIVRHHYLRFDIKRTPIYLVNAGIRVSFDMGFASTQGFRAGTWSPFPYFNFLKNQTENFWFFPFCAMDGNYFIYEHISAESAWEKLKQILSILIKENGIACLVFHERTLSNMVIKNYNQLLTNFLEF